MKEMKEFEKELSKLRKRGAVGVSIFVREGASVEDCAKEATLFMKGMKKSKTKRMG